MKRLIRRLEDLEERLRARLAGAVGPSPVGQALQRIRGEAGEERYRPVLDALRPASSTRVITPEIADAWREAIVDLLLGADEKTQARWAGYLDDAMGAEVRGRP